MDFLNNIDIQFLSAIVSITAVTLSSLVASFYSHKGMANAKRDELFFAERAKYYLEFIEFSNNLYLDCFQKKRSISPDELNKLFTLSARASLFSSSETFDTIQKLKKVIAYTHLEDKDNPKKPLEYLSESFSASQKVLDSMRKDLKKRRYQ